MGLYRYFKPTKVSNSIKASIQLVLPCTFFIVKKIRLTYLESRYISESRYTLNHGYIFFIKRNFKERVTLYTRS
jgi:hypothetical protein